MTKKLSRRSKRKYPALENDFNLKLRRDYVDYDYVGDLKRQAKSKDLIKAQEAREALEFLNKYTEETISASLKNSRFYKDNEDKRKIYNENNARNRCLFNRQKSSGKLDYMQLEDDSDTNEKVYDPTNDIIDFIDENNDREEFISELNEANQFNNTENKTKKSG